MKVFEEEKTIEDLEHEEVLDKEKIFIIPFYNMDQAEAKVKELQKKIEKLRSRGEEELEDIVFEIVGESEIEHPFETLGGKPIKIPVYKVKIKGSRPIIKDWELIGKIDHNQVPTNEKMTEWETLNIISEVPGKTIPKKYRKSYSDCDHCRTRRFRKKTYIVRNVKTGEYQQVGSTCLKDFLGHSSPENVMNYAENIIDFSKVLESLEAPMEAESWKVGISSNYFNLEYFLAIVAYCIEKYGWVSKSQAYDDPTLEPTALCAQDLYRDSEKGKFDSWSSFEKLQDHHHTLAKETIEFAKTKLSKDDDSYLYNLHVISLVPYFDIDKSGLVASMIGQYQRWKSKEDLKKLQITSESKYVGNVDDRVILLLYYYGYSEWVSDYGFMTSYYFHDQYGNRIAWKTGKNLEIIINEETITQIFPVEKNTWIRARATIKKHYEYEGIKRTSIRNVVPLDFVSEEQLEMQKEGIIDLTRDPLKVRKIRGIPLIKEFEDGKIQKKIRKNITLQDLSEYIVDQILFNWEQDNGIILSNRINYRNILLEQAKELILIHWAKNA